MFPFNQVKKVQGCYQRYEVRIVFSFTLKIFVLHGPDTDQKIRLLRQWVIQEIKMTHVVYEVSKQYFIFLAWITWSTDPVFHFWTWHYKVSRHLEKIKLLHSGKQSNLDWTKVLPEGWKSLNWPTVISIHREILIHKLTISFLQIAGGKICQKSSAKLSEQIFLMLCWLKRITWCLVVTVFPVIICLNKRMHYLTGSP